MRDRPTRREFTALGFAMLATGRSAALAQQAAEKPAAEPLPKPDPIPEPSVKLLTELPTVPVPRNAPAYNVKMVDASLLPRDKQGIWVLDFAFKSLRMYTVEIAGKRRNVHYLYYRVVNRTGKPRDFVPQFTLVTDTNKRYEEAVIPKAIPLIKGREDPDRRVLGAVEIAGVIPPTKSATVDSAVFGVAMWDHVDPKADRLQIFVRGLSDGYQRVSDPSGGAAVTRYKTLRIDLIRRGDDRNLNEQEITLAEPPYEWIYW